MIKIGNAVIKSDGLSFIITATKRIVSKKTGEEKDSEHWIGYYPTLESALMCILDRGLMVKEHKTIHEMLDSIKEYRNDIQEMKGLIQEELKNEILAGRNN